MNVQNIHAVQIVSQSFNVGSECRRGATTEEIVATAAILEMIREAVEIVAEGYDKYGQRLSPVGRGIRVDASA